MDPVLSLDVQELPQGDCVEGFQLYGTALVLSRSNDSPIHFQFSLQANATSVQDIGV